LPDRGLTLPWSDQVDTRSGASGRVFTSDF
jgi:hypothetical protein